VGNAVRFQLIFACFFVKNYVRLNQMFEFILPTRLIMGCGSLNRLADSISPFGKKVLVVSGKRLKDRLEYILSSFDVFYFSDTSSEPTWNMINKGAEIAKEKEVDVVVSVGGGAQIDCGKAIAGIANKDLPYDKTKPIEYPGLPFIAVPTTGGSGAEVTPNAVLIDKNKKESLRNHYLFPKIAIIDPELCLSLPPKQTAYSGMDALSHSIESYVSKGKNIISKALCEKSILLIKKSIISAYKDGSLIGPREDMSYASLMAGISLFNARLGIVHAVAHPVGVLYHIPHGIVCGVLLPYSVKFNYKEASSEYIEIENLIGYSLIDWLFELLEEFFLPKTLKELGVKKDDFSKIIEDSLPSGSLAANPKKAEKDELFEFLEMAYEN